MSLEYIKLPKEIPSVNIYILWDMLLTLSKM